MCWRPVSLKLRDVKPRPMYLVIGEKMNCFRNSFPLTPRPTQKVPSAASKTHTNIKDAQGQQRP